jgi:hypothetical protein
MARMEFHILELRFGLMFLYSMLALDFLENIDGLSRCSGSQLGSKRSHKLDKSVDSTRQKITNGNNESHS